MPARQPPGPEALAAFGVVDARPEPLRGGAGTSWRARGHTDLVLKPVGGPSAETEVGWWAAALPDVRARVSGIRLVTPVPTVGGRWTADGWRADVWLPGEPRPDRPLDVLAAAERLHAALAPLPAPSFLRARSDRWALADRAAWGEIEIEIEIPAPFEALARRLRRLTTPSDEPPQLVHLDLLGNVLLAPGLAPAVIDLSPYRRPAVHGSAVVVADALLRGGSSEALLSSTGWAGTPPALARALLFRLLDEGQQAADGTATIGLAPYERVATTLERMAAAAD
ncbi:MAG TPA: TIGR02569 family protein [Amnibacterium sp.]|jgi:uncharacterized protein (TIGR02569 family)|uniref:TIGR02569 family protein n=1 Tax=Amnibacterium sp. TaxID=1872496 RepID=UPI002F95DF74